MKEIRNTKQETVEEAYKKITKITKKIPIEGDGELTIALINNTDEWKSLCFYLNDNYYDSKNNGFEVVGDEPLSYPALISIKVEDGEVVYRMGKEARTTDENGNVVLVKRTINGKEYPLYEDVPVTDILSGIKDLFDTLNNFVDSIKI